MLHLQFYTTNSGVFEQMPQHEVTIWQKNVKICSLMLILFDILQDSFTLIKFSLNFQ